VRGLDEPLDLVITDLVMPEMSGFRLVEMLLEIQPDLRALYISGYSSDEVRWSGVPGSSSRSCRSPSPWTR
jgi:CheY-like chemotaxis protein